MSPIKIGPLPIADSTGTHAPGEIIDFPHPDLLELANSGAKDPESGLVYCKVVSHSSKTKPAPDPELEPTPEPEPTPDPEPLAEPALETPA